MAALSRFQVTLLRLAIIVFLLPASCVGPPFLYYFSPWILARQVDIESDSLFYVAYYTQKKREDKKLFVTPYKNAVVENNQSTRQYRLIQSEISYQFGGIEGEGEASISVESQNEKEQIIRIFVSGDTPRTSLSEYRVVDNKVFPLRYARSNVWILVAWPIAFFLIQAINSWLASLEEKKYEGPDPPQFGRMG